MADILTVTDAVSLQTIIGAAQHNAKVARLMDDYVIYGIARSICNDSFYTLGPQDDVRDGFLRVTTQGGMETLWPVRELLAQVPTAEFCQYDW
jgi:hypothetical protein